MSSRTSPSSASRPPTVPSAPLCPGGTEPSAPGARPPSPFSIWLWAARPRTLPLAASAIALGFGLAIMQGATRWGVFLLALATALLLQILSNLANDYGDAVAGTDREDRLGPQRMVGSGLASPRQMFLAMMLAAALALAAGLALVVLGTRGDGPMLAVFLALGAACIAAAILYTVGKRPYGYMGLGDLMAGLFFGPVAVWGCAVLCGAEQFTPLFLPGMAAGLCSTMVLNVNNLRDIETDGRSGKLTVAVRLGRAWTVYYHTTLAMLVLLCWTAFWLVYRPPCLAGLLFAVPLMVSVRRVARRPGEAVNLNAQLRNTVLGSAILGTGMAVLCAFSR